MSDIQSTPFQTPQDEPCVYLESKVYPVLLKGLENLLETLKDSDGTFDLYPDSMLHPVTWLALVLFKNLISSIYIKNLETPKT